MDWVLLCLGILGIALALRACRGPGGPLPMSPWLATLCAATGVALLAAHRWIDISTLTPGRKLGLRRAMVAAMLFLGWVWLFQG